MTTSNEPTIHVEAEWLPAGWTCEHPKHWPNVVYIERPQDVGGGAVSLDFKLRVWNGGIQLPREFPDRAKRTYGGRNWKRTMVDEACAWLESVMAPGSHKVHRNG